MCHFYKRKYFKYERTTRKKPFLGLFLNFFLSAQHIYTKVSATASVSATPSQVNRGFQTANGNFAIHTNHIKFLPYDFSQLY